ncbi:MAG: hypothetical protein ACREQR_05525 [Candidatus Binataceae bacterium]
MVTIPVNVLITTDESERLPEIVKNLEALGLHVVRQMEHIGVVQGQIPSGSVDTLRNVKGVANVELSKTFRIAPPDSEVQ